MKRHFNNIKCSRERVVEYTANCYHLQRYTGLIDQLSLQQIRFAMLIHMLEANHGMRRAYKINVKLGFFLAYAPAHSTPGNE